MKKFIPQGLKKGIKRLISRTTRAYNFLETCPICGGKDFYLNKILWPELIHEWKLSPEEVHYMNKQQGGVCLDCDSNLRSMALARAIQTHLNGPMDITFQEFVNRPEFKNVSILEINTAGNLTKYLSLSNRHSLQSYPAIDIENMEKIPDGSVSLVVHSDTLEHIPHPIKALSECLRVLEPGGACCFTIPIIVDRMTLSREGMPPSYHGDPKLNSADFKVFTEYGADFWTQLAKAGFRDVRTIILDYPSAIAIIGRKG